MNKQITKKKKNMSKSFTSLIFKVYIIHSGVFVQYVFFSVILMTSFNFFFPPDLFQWRFR